MRYVAFALLYLSLCACAAVMPAAQEAEPVKIVALSIPDEIVRTSIAISALTAVLSHDDDRYSDTDRRKAELVRLATMRAMGVYVYAKLKDGEREAVDRIEQHIMEMLHQEKHGDSSSAR